MTKWHPHSTCCVFWLSPASTPCKTVYETTVQTPFPTFILPIPVEFCTCLTVVMLWLGSGYLSVGASLVKLRYHRLYGFAMFSEKNAPGGPGGVASFSWTTGSVSATDLVDYAVQWLPALVYSKLSKGVGQQAVPAAGEQFTGSPGKYLYAASIACAMFMQPYSFGIGSPVLMCNMQ